MKERKRLTKGDLLYFLTLIDKELDDLRTYMEIFELLDKREHIERYNELRQVKLRILDELVTHDS